MSVRIIADVWDFGPEDPIESDTLAVLGNYANDKGLSCYPSVERIARMIRRSVRTTERAIADLEAGGWIVVKRGDGRGKVSSYEINMKRLKERSSTNIFTVPKGRQGDALSEEGRQSDALSIDQKGVSDDTERATTTTEKGDSQTRKGVSNDTPIEEPLGTKTRTVRGTKHPLTARSSHFPSIGSDGELELAAELLRELKLSTGHADVKATAEQIAYEAPERGGTFEAFEFIKNRGLEAIARGEKVTMWWIKDRKFTDADVYANFSLGLDDDETE